MDRRFFLMGSALQAGAFTASSLAGPNDKIRVALVGLRSQAKNHIRFYSEMVDVDIVALCDVDEKYLNQRLEEIEKMGRKRPAAYTDYRKLLEDKSIDAVSLATPNFHHTLQTIWACQAGKDVYVEKPCSHNMFEAKQIVAAARKYNRMVQHGTNARSSGSSRSAIRQIREGAIGDVYMARALSYKFRPSIGRAPEEPVPAGVHYDLWLGPAEARPFTKNRFHSTWHMFWEYGNGEVGDQGIHQIDVARWGLGVKYPTRVTATGGKFMFDDDQETPNTLVATFEFDDAGKKKFLVFEARHWMTNPENDITVGDFFYGSKGYMTIKHGGPNSVYKIYLGKENAPAPNPIEGGPNNWRNFIECVRSRDLTKLNADVEEGAISTVLVHLANISYRLNRSVQFDPKTVTCVGDAEANAMFGRDYRKPFVVPEKV